MQKSYEYNSMNFYVFHPCPCFCFTLLRFSGLLLQSLSFLLTNVCSLDLLYAIHEAQTPVRLSFVPLSSSSCAVNHDDHLTFNLWPVTLNWPLVLEGKNILCLSHSFSQSWEQVFLSVLKISNIFSLIFMPCWWSLFHLLRK